jgi:hypothetical protein
LFEKSNGFRLTCARADWERNKNNNKVLVINRGMTGGLNLHKIGQSPDLSEFPSGVVAL